jgi:hypothetical protein
VLQQRPHTDKATGTKSTTHTHEAKSNTLPDGTTRKDASRKNTHTPTYEEVKRIEDGTAIKIQ